MEVLLMIIPPCPNSLIDGMHPINQYPPLLQAGICLTPHPLLLRCMMEDLNIESSVNLDIIAEV
jgi:hypothetical protein